MLLPKKKKKKKIILAALVTFLTIGAVVCGTLIYQTRKNEYAHDNPATDNIVTDKDQSITDGESGDKDKTIVTQTPMTTDSSSQKPEQPLITRAEQSGAYLRITATLAQPSNGTCVLKLEKPGQSSIAKNAQVIVGPSYYTCDGFRVPLSELPVTGVWTATITHQLNGSENASSSVAIEVK